MLKQALSPSGIDGGASPGTIPGSNSGSGAGAGLSERGVAQVVDAANAFRRALRNDPSNAVAHWDLGVAHFVYATNVHAEADADADADTDANLTMSGALYHLEAAVGLNPDVDFIQFNHGAVLAANNKLVSQSTSLSVCLSVSVSPLVS